MLFTNHIAQLRSAFIVLSLNRFLHFALQPIKSLLFSLGALESVLKREGANLDTGAAARAAYSAD